MKKFIVFKKSFLPWIVVGVLLISNLFTYIYFSQKLETTNDALAVDTIISVIETSDNSASIYDFSKEQYKEGAIDSASYSAVIQNIIDVHKKLSTMVDNKGRTKNINSLADLTIQMLDKRKEGYNNYKSAIDLTSDNFNSVATQDFSEADQLSKQIKQVLQNYK